MVTGMPVLINATATIAYFCYLQVVIKKTALAPQLYFKNKIVKLHNSVAKNNILRMNCNF